MAHQLQIKTASLPPATDGAIVIYVSEGGRPEGAGGTIWTAAGLNWDRAAEATGFKGKQGQVMDIVAPAGLEANRVIVLGGRRVQADIPWAQEGAYRLEDRIRW